MLKINKSIVEKINEKYTTITITNVCNLSCGGCNQLCGLFDKKKLWFMSLGEIKRSIEIIKKYNKAKDKTIGIFGGEPTIHPEWDSILDLLYEFKDCNFIVYTNGRINVSEKYGATQSKNLKEIFIKKNVKFNVSPKCGENKNSNNIEHLPQLIAPIDHEPNKDKTYFWKKAQKKCVMWNLCGKTIYNNKAYFCEAAAAFDNLEGGNRGWEMKDDEDPFNKRKHEIDEQAKEFCYRCGNLWSGDWWNIPGFSSRNGLPKGVEIQHIDDAYFVSKTNLELIDKNKKNKIELKVIQQNS